MSARNKIADKLVELLKTIDGTATWSSNLYNNVFKGLKFWDEVDDYPSVFVNIGYESRRYEPGGVKWGYIYYNIRIYVQDEEPEARLEEIFDDIETVIDMNGNMEYDTNQKIEDMKIMSINTDEGLLNPIGVGEITIQVMYALLELC